MRRHPASTNRRPLATTPQGVYSVTTATTLAEDMATMSRALVELGNMFQQDVDIHTFTRPIGAICNQVFLAIDHKHQLTTATSADFEKFAQEIMTLANTQRDPQKVQTVLNSIRSNRDKQDAETHLHVMTLLVKTWELAKNVHYSNAQELVLDNLRHNKDTGGGCYPGIAARLVQLYSVFIHTTMENKQAPQARQHNLNEIDDPNLAAAIAASLLQQQPQTEQVDTFEEEELDDLALALLMSMPSRQYRPSHLEQPALRQSQEAIDDDAALAEALQRSLYMQ